MGLNEETLYQEEEEVKGNREGMGRDTGAGDGGTAARPPPAPPWNPPGLEGERGSSSQTHWDIGGQTRSRGLQDENTTHSLAGRGWKKNAPTLPSFCLSLPLDQKGPSPTRSWGQRSPVTQPIKVRFLGHRARYIHICTSEGQKRGQCHFKGHQ